MPFRRSTIHSLELVEYDGSTATLDLLVGSGTYVRSIAAELGGHCSSLRRTEVGPFHVDDADLERIIPAEEVCAGAINDRTTGRRPRRVRRRPSRTPSRHRGRAGASGPPTTVPTFDPHPRIALGNQVELLTTLERRAAALRARSRGRRRSFHPGHGARHTGRNWQPDLAAAGDEGGRRGRELPVGRGRSGDLDTLEGLGFDVQPVSLLEGHLIEPDPPARPRRRDRRGSAAARRPHEVEGTVVSGTRGAARWATRRRTSPSRPR